MSHELAAKYPCWWQTPIDGTIVLSSQSIFSRQTRLADQSHMGAPFLEGIKALHQLCLLADPGAPAPEWYTGLGLVNGWSMDGYAPHMIVIGFEPIPICQYHWKAPLFKSLSLWNSEFVLFFTLNICRKLAEKPPARLQGFGVRLSFHPILRV